MTIKTDEEILSDATKCPKMYLECVADAIKQARTDEREKVAKEIFDRLDEAGICLIEEFKQKYLGKDGEKNDKTIMPTLWK